MDTVPEKISFPKTEEEILELWDRLDAFQESMRRSKAEGRPEYTFYDGPPFATGLPHYGHILAGTIKDIVTRYAHQSGYHVSRRFGWDCHGLPVEYEIDTKLGIKGKDDVMKMGIDKYNAECRSIVMRYSGEWEVIVKRLGRWIDFQKDYKTMEPWYMESVWWVFSQMFKKGLVYKGFKVMPYSTACTTPLSNFEANLNYKDVSDPAVVVNFPCLDEPDVLLLAWTTTPWTLPSNLALCVNPEKDYVKIKDIPTGNTYIVMEARLCELYKDPAKAQKEGKGQQFQLLSKFKGKELEGKAYKPLFEYFKSEVTDKAWHVVCDTYVTEDSGTGIVHCAPAFGEDDYRVCLANGVIVKGGKVPCPVDDDGKFTPNVTDFAGEHVKSADAQIMKKLKAEKRVVNQGSIVHKYPFCWRSETPLIYKAVPSWFVKVEEIKERLLKNNLDTYWVPAFVQEKRFHNWLRDARDWAISRNRYWGTPLPIWISDDGEEVVVVESIAELEKLSGQKLTDIHREFVDKVTIPSQQGKGVLHRVPEVFDCWFESGSMPYAQVHYPFENKERFEAGFPADFIAEGLDQTRGWFYTLMVISTALFDKPAFKNLIVNGLVLASDGKKMSKRLKNYPDPTLVVNELGADALRLYLINSPVVRAEPLRFQKDGVLGVVKDVFLPWYNAYRFFVQNALRMEQETGTAFQAPHDGFVKSTNYMDQWVQASFASLLQFTHQEMKAYRLYTVVPRLVKFIEDLTNWYVRLNRNRLKGASGPEESRTSLSILFEILLDLCKLMAPLTPFLTEHMYQNLVKVLPANRRQESVHYEMLPQPNESAFNTHIEDSVKVMQTCIQLTRGIRDRVNISMKNPLKELKVVHSDKKFLDAVVELESYIKDECNVKSVTLETDTLKFVSLRARPDGKVLGPRFGKAFKGAMAAIQKLTSEQLIDYLKTGKITIEGVEVAEGELTILRDFKGEADKYDYNTDNDVVVLLDIRPDDEMMAEGLARSVLNRVQKMRKKAGLQVDDPIEVFFKVSGGKTNGTVVNNAIKNNMSLITGTLKVPMVSVDKMPKSAVVLERESADLNGEDLELVVTRATAAVSEKSLAKMFTDEAVRNEIRAAVLSRDFNKLKVDISAKKTVTIEISGRPKAELVPGRDIFVNTADMLSSEQ